MQISLKYFHCLKSLFGNTKMHCKFSNLKENVRTFLKIVNFLCNNIWSENVLFYHKACFPEKCEFYWFYCNTNLKDCVLFKWTKSSIEIHVLKVKKKKHVFLNFVEKYARLKGKKSSCYYNYHYWMSLEY